jgi:hypothetical protein
VAKDTLTSKTSEEIEEIISRVHDDVSAGRYDFSTCDSIVLNYGGKKRFVKEYKDIYSTESILCLCIKHILDRTFRVKYPNRNKAVRELFNVLTAVKQMGAFTIVKFDFKDYFNSISTPYVFEKYIRSQMSDRFEVSLICDFVNQTRYAYAGLGTSNVISEIIAKHFDDEIRKAFISKSVLFFERYIDDAILIFNENITTDEIQRVMNHSLELIYRDSTISVKPKCKTRFNVSKFFHVTKNGVTASPISFDYLGYEVFLRTTTGKKGKSDIDVKYGITQGKQDKYKERVSDFISLYTNPASLDYRNLEMLRHRLCAFTSRTVYQGSKYNSSVWKVKGFIANYGELRYLLDEGQVDVRTVNYLKTMLEDAFSVAGISLPYFLKGEQNRAGYSLFENMRRNKTLLFVERIGYDYNSLAEKCAQLGIKTFDKDEKKRGYGTMVREYLIKTKVGY